MEKHLQKHVCCGNEISKGDGSEGMNVSKSSEFFFFLKIRSHYFIPPKLTYARQFES